MLVKKWRFWTTKSFLTVLKWKCKNRIIPSPEPVDTHILVLNTKTWKHLTSGSYRDPLQYLCLLQGFSGYFITYKIYRRQLQLKFWVLFTTKYYEQRICTIWLRFIYCRAQKTIKNPKFQLLRKLTCSVYWLYFPLLTDFEKFFYLSRTLRNEESSIIHIEKIKTSYGRKKLTGM